MGVTATDGCSTCSGTVCAVLYASGGRAGMEVGAVMPKGSM